MAVESFPELRDVERDRVSLEVRVVHTQRSHQRTTIKIGRTAWPFVVATLARFEIVEVCVALLPRFVPASSSSVVELPPYDLETSRPEYSEMHP